MFKNMKSAKNMPIFAAFLAFILLIVAGELVTTRIVKNQILIDEAKLAGHEWLNGLTSFIPELKYGLSQGEIAAHTVFALSRSGMNGNIYHYKLYDMDCKSVYDSAQQYLSFTPSKVVSKTAGDMALVKQGNEVVHLGSFSRDGVSISYAQAFIPILKGSEVIGFLEIYLDQTQSSAALASAFSIIAIVTAILLIIAMSFLGTIVMRWLKEQQQSETALNRARCYDKLTGLPNRDEYMAKVKSLISSSDGEKDCVVTMCVDIDDFKKLNDTLGFDIGNRILLRASKVCTDCVRESDIVARIGDDKFAITMSRDFGANSIQDVATRLSALMAQPLEIDGKIIHMTSSIGVGFATPEDADPVRLLKNAEVALHWSKSEGGGAIRVFQQSMDKTLHERMNLESELRRAVMNEEFAMYYQPQVDMVSGQVIGCEALMRWEHPKRGFISPEIFISIAEDNGIIHRLGEWALKRACSDALCWPLPVNIAVNMSPRQIEVGGMEKIVAEVLQDTGLPANRLELEITENVLIKNPEHAIVTLDTLHEMGVAIAMDDFGTGYSSLAYLSRFQFDKIKIDRSFIKKLETDPNVLPIVRTMIGLGHSLSSKVIAEGVETESEAEILRQEGCSLAQGYLYAKPMPQSELVKFITGQITAVGGSTHTEDTDMVA